jgi:hypothetical protein
MLTNGEPGRGSWRRGNCTGCVGRLRADVSVCGGGWEWGEGCPCFGASGRGGRLSTPLCTRPSALGSHGPPAHMLSAALQAALELFPAGGVHRVTADTYQQLMAASGVDRVKVGGWGGWGVGGGMDWCVPTDFPTRVFLPACWACSALGLLSQFLRGKACPVGCRAAECGAAARSADRFEGADPRQLRPLQPPRVHVPHQALTSSRRHRAPGGAVQRQGGASCCLPGPQVSLRSCDAAAGRQRAAGRWAMPVECRCRAAVLCRRARAQRRALCARRSLAAVVAALQRLCTPTPPHPSRPRPFPPRCLLQAFPSRSANFRPYKMDFGFVHSGDSQLMEQFKVPQVGPRRSKV